MCIYLNLFKQTDTIELGYKSETSCVDNLDLYQFPVSWIIVDCHNAHLGFFVQTNLNKPQLSQANMGFFEAKLEKFTTFFSLPFQAFEMEPPNFILSYLPDLLIRFPSTWKPTSDFKILYYRSIWNCTPFFKIQYLCLRNLWSMYFFKQIVFILLWML